MRRGLLGEHRVGPVPAAGEVAIAATRKTSTASSTPARRGRPPTLTEEQIVDAALKVIHSDGLEALSMRRLSRELDRSAMVAYSYVSDKNSLLDLVGRKLLSRVVLPPDDFGPWDVRLRAILEDIDAQLHRYPGIASIMLERLVSGDRRVINGIMEILVSAGLDGAEAHLAYATVHTYLFGRYQVVLQGDHQYPEGDLEDTLSALMPHLGGLRGTDFFNYGLDVIIAGLRAQLSTERSSRGRARPRPSTTRHPRT
jgi:TetR/AcrR family transcriptional regulator, tetracycline repressor protein